VRFRGGLRAFVVHLRTPAHPTFVLKSLGLAESAPHLCSWRNVASSSPVEGGLFEHRVQYVRVGSERHSSEACGSRLVPERDAVVLGGRSARSSGELPRLSKTVFVSGAVITTHASDNNQISRHYRIWEVATSRADFYLLQRLPLSRNRMEIARRHRQPAQEKGRQGKVFVISIPFHKCFYASKRIGSLRRELNRKSSRHQRTLPCGFRLGRMLPFRPYR